MRRSIHARRRIDVTPGESVKLGTIVDATIIHASSSAKNAGKCRDTEMPQTRKGNQVV